MDYFDLKKLNKTKILLAVSPQDVADFFPHLFQIHRHWS